MLRALREQVQEVLYAVPVKRRPALRRSDAPDALLATDLPLVAAAAAVEAFRADMERLGWRCKARNGWLTLDAAVPEPHVVLREPPQGECGCCVSLLQRHPDDAPAEDFIREVVKAADAGRQPFERLCGLLHAELAKRLRNHEPLPGALASYLCHAYVTICK